MAMSKRKKFKFLLAVEIVTILILAVVLYITLKFKEIKHQEIDKKNLSIKKDIKGFTNIILFGVDAREDQLTKGTRSDTMILVTINEKTKDITLTSFYRDYFSFSTAAADLETLNSLEPKHFDKLTHAYTHGPEEAIKTINLNFDLDIKHYVAVNFLALVRVVDQLGGIELNVKNNEMIQEINRYGGEIARKNGEPFTKVTKTGLQTLNGYQSLGYARTRKKDSDYHRAQRQREVINKVLAKIKSGAGLTKLQSIYKSITKNMVTNFTTSEILSLMKDAPKYNINQEATSDYGNGYPYHVTSFKYRRTQNESMIYYAFSTQPYTDISLLHYNLFNNGVLPEQLQGIGSNSNEAETQKEGLGYIYSPSDDVLNITNFLTDLYNKNTSQ